MKKTIYEIYKHHKEVRAHDYVGYEQGMTLDDTDPELILRFDTLEEAMKEIKNPYYQSDVSFLQYSPFNLYHVTEFILWEQEVEIDDDGEIEYLQGGTLEISGLPYKEA